MGVRRREEVFQSLGRQQAGTIEELLLQGLRSHGCLAAHPTTGRAGEMWIGPGLRKEDVPSPTAAELEHRQPVARVKHIQVETQVSQTFWVTYTEEGAQ
eukprot:916940-Rhodomonas_salina.1